MKEEDMKRFNEVINGIFGSMTIFVVFLFIGLTAIAIKALGLEFGAPVGLFAMTALAADRKTEFKEGVQIPFPWRRSPRSTLEHGRPSMRRAISFRVRIRRG
jgi:hypothetical protein